jgi:alpha-beta hydrolase superfamily lysophospholipase
VSDGLLPPPAASSTLRAADGTRLHALRWPADRPRAALLLSHGLGEHAGRYAALARDLAPRGIEVHALDHRGHGRSGGARAYVDRFSRFVDDFEAFRLHAVDALPAGLPVFVLGHSLGGLIALRWLEAHPEAGLAGAVLSAPLLGVKTKAPRWKLALSGMLSRLLPWLPLSNEIDPAELSGDPAYVRSYREDPLVHARITPRLYTEMMAAIGDAVAERGRLALPLLFLVPGADSIVREEETLRFAAGLAGDVTVRRYPGFRHESLNELERARPVADVAGWIEARIG